MSDFIRHRVTELRDNGTRRRSNGITGEASAERDATRLHAGNGLTHHDLVLQTLAGLVLGSLALIPLDKSAETWLQRPGLQSNSVLQSAASGFNWLGGAGLITGSVAAPAVGRLTGNDRLSEVGLRTTEAILASGAMVGVAKGLVGRQRPGPLAHPRVGRT